VYKMENKTVLTGKGDLIISNTDFVAHMKNLC